MRLLQIDLPSLAAQKDMAAPVAIADPRGANLFNPRFQAVGGRMAPLIIGRPDQKSSTGRDNRMFVEGVLWIVRTGSLA
jgi:hypothetical protein